MRILSLITVGVGALAFADAQACTDIPGFSAVGTGAGKYCAVGGTAVTGVAGTATFGQNGANGAVYVYPGTVIGAQAYVGKFTVLGASCVGSPTCTWTETATSSEIAVADVTIAPKARLEDGVSFATGTRIASGTIGRRTEFGDQDSVGTDLSAAADVVVGRNVTLGHDVTLGYGAIINDNAWLGDDVQLGNLSTVGFSAWIGDKTSVGRSTFIGNYAEVCNVDLGPDVEIGSYSSVGQCDENGDAAGFDGAKVRRGAQIGKHVTVEEGTRIGRDVTLLDHSTVEAGATIRSGSTVLEGGVVGMDAFIAKNTTVPGNPLNVPPEPSGTFFSAAGGKVCVEKPGFVDGACHFLGMDDDGTSPRPVYTGGPACSYPNVGGNPDPRCAPDRYCLDDDQDHVCDTHVSANQPAQAITVTAPTTIGVSPYSYNNGTTACPTGTGIVQTGPSGGPYTCTVTVGGMVDLDGAGPNPAEYVTLQAGPIFVLSPPTPN